MLDDVWNLLEENVVQVVNDNATNFKAVGDLLIKAHLYWTLSATHCIDFIFKDFWKEFKVHQVTIKKGRRITTYICGKTVLTSMLKTLTNGKNLIRPDD